MSALPDEVRAAIQADPLSALVDHFGREVRPSDAFSERGDGGWCDGASFAEAGLVLYRPAASRREHFALAHEIGHLLLEDDDIRIDWVADEPDPERVQESLCDAIAARLLIPDDELDAVLAGQPPAAEHIHQLYQLSRASRTACLIAVCGRLPCHGLALLVEDRSDRLFHASRAHDARPYAWPGDVLPPAHPLHRQGALPATAKSWWPSPGGERRSYYQSVDQADVWTYVLLAENDLWGVTGLHLDDLPPEDRGYGGDIVCRCGYRGTTPWYPCNECGKPTCPSCHECDCQQRDRRNPWTPCARCGVSARSSLLDKDGICPDW